MRYCRKTGERRNDGAYPRGFRHLRPVDIAYVTYPFRANENDGVFLVNGAPVNIDVDNQGLLAQGKRTKNSAYATLGKAVPTNFSRLPHPNKDTLWRGVKSF